MNGNLITFRTLDDVELGEPVDCDSPTDIFDGGELTLNCQIKQSDYEKLFNMLAYGKQNHLAPEQFEDSEKHLKQRIKYAKTPMERKMYEKQLNALYKKRKRK